ncbi:fumarylacetoacetate hydrolase family protein [Sphingomonas sp. MG17]|uniref:Fumarylacetoacetate hydrolase family protein n=1 Tax=Sphingomonas tagetis TaxID=2949092 RepID=A0A9X2HSZ7_9SPHN|nr:fumarylacetoacetate hydrolase family protein [Sphingomonas tagetis]MCP3731355.1 fumarylacetoacetate hydrolase family protein [Sphingomonas tagetis]
MKLATFAHGGKISYGAVIGNDIVDLGAKFGDRYPDLRSLLDGDGLAEAQRTIATATPGVSADDVTWLPVIPNPDKIICVGLNYRSHIGETGRTSAEERPVIFTRFAASQVGHLQSMICPVESERFDYEGELVAVIGKRGRRIAESDALDHVAGYSIYNDGSVRDFQLHTHQWGPGKNFEGTGAFGPWMVTSDAFGDPYTHNLTTRLNGAVMQDSSIGLMVFNIQAVIAYASTFTELLPGDVIVTGTPGGVGNARKPPIYMHDGDTVEVEITGIGTLRNPVVKERS